MAEKPPQHRSFLKECLAITLLSIAASAIVLTGALFVVSLVDPLQWGDPVFTVAITGVTGLDPARDVDPLTSPPADGNYSSSAPPAALSPVFNLTFQIDNSRNPYYDACIPGLSRADVSYGDAFLAGGSVPPFCAAKLESRSGGVAATAWGDSVVVPQFLRHRLAAELAAGDASVDVKVTMPRYCWEFSCGGAVLSCKPKIRGGMSPACRLDFLQDSPASLFFIQRLVLPLLKI